MKSELKQNLNVAGMVLLILLLSSSILRMPYFMVQRSLIFINGYGMPPFASQLFQSLIYCGTMLITIFFGVWLLGCSRQFLFPLSTPRGDYLYPAIAVGLGVTMVGNVIATFLTALLSLGGIYSNENAPTFDGGPATTLLTFISVAVLPAILEELLFRGVLLQPLRRYGDRVAIVLSALLFAFCHPVLPQFINAFIVGLCLGLFAVRSGSLVVPMLIHLVYNATACGVTLLSERLPIGVAAAISWLLILSLLGLGIYGSFVLRRRFGRVCWVSPNAYIPTRFSQAAVAILCSIPLMLALLLNAGTIIRNLYRY
ncbi:MAG: type II CAAX endopeptidase family protein [Angelakisella sp.]